LQRKGFHDTGADAAAAAGDDDTLAGQAGIDGLLARPVVIFIQSQVSRDVENSELGRISRNYENHQSRS
jgi:hypothetical protein